MKQRLDQELVKRQLVMTRSQAESYIKLGKVRVNKTVVTKPAHLVGDNDKIKLDVVEQYVSRAALKLASADETFKLNFNDKTVLDVGSSTGGFTDYALKHGAEKVIAVDVGTDQLHHTLRGNEKIELHEQTDIRNFVQTIKRRAISIDIVVIDVSFISLREILLPLFDVIEIRTQVIAMVKPQFEAQGNAQKHKGIIKNDHMRRDILKDFEAWAKRHFVIIDKADSAVAGEKGNIERFYLLKKSS